MNRLLLITFIILILIDIQHYVIQCLHKLQYLCIQVATKLVHMNIISLYRNMLSIASNICDNIVLVIIELLVL